MSQETVNYQCPACGGPLRFAGESGRLQCDYCDSAFTPQEVEEHYAAKHASAEAASTDGEEKPVTATEQERAQSKADPIQEYLKRSKWEGEEAEQLSAYTCSSCGAELICDVTTAVTACPYCGNPTVVPGKLGGALRPDYVIPFKKTREEAVAKLKEYYQGKRFLPKAFANANHLEEIQGIYVPFWLYDGTVSGEAVFIGTEVRTWNDSRYRYTETSRYRLERAGHLEFARVPADGSVKMPDAHMDAIEPYDYTELVPFSLGYLPGYLTDRYDVDAQACRERVERRVGESLEQALEATATGHGTTTTERCTAQARCEQVRYALLPVWMLHTRYEGEDYLFAMNGQTGRMVGDLPVSKGRVAAWFGGLTAALTVAFTVVLTLAMG